MHPTANTQDHRVVSREAWLIERRALLEREKAATRLRDSINVDRLALPWVRVETSYLFDTGDGPRSLAELFAGRSQLIVYLGRLPLLHSLAKHGCITPGRTSWRC